MPRRICDACGKEKDVYGGKVCSKGHFICSGCYMSGGSTKCPLCGMPLLKREEVMTEEKVSYFISLADAPKLTQMVGLETTILTGLHGEKMMMVLNTYIARSYCAAAFSSTRANRNGIRWQGKTAHRRRGAYSTKRGFLLHSRRCSA